VDTTGGTHHHDGGQVIGFKLARVFVEGPIARKQVIAREVVIEVGDVDGTMTIDMAQADSTV
jgi:hypothetical protein